MIDSARDTCVLRQARALTNRACRLENRSTWCVSTLMQVWNMKLFSRIANPILPSAGFLAVLMLFSSLPGLGQQTPPAKQRPKLGLALQGGGALGLAHVGVITWMEEHHIPVDYVAGTSMGGLVGGVYGTGRTALNSGRW